MSRLVLSFFCAFLCLPLSAQEGGAVWSQQAAATIQDLEASWRSTTDGELTTAHRGAGLRASLSADGLTIRPRQSGDGDWLLALRTTAWGRSDLVPLGPATTSASGRRAALHRDELVEWFVHLPDGIQQGWTIAAPPGSGARGELRLRVAFHGMSADIAADGLSAQLRDALGQPRLSYAGLAAWDALGQPLAARLLPDDGGLLVSVEDRDATYPITIDPVLGGLAWAHQSDQANARLGWTVASAGDVNGDGYDDVLVGAPVYDTLVTDGGAIFLFHGSPGGLSTTPDWVEEFDLEAEAHFGTSVASAGDVNGDGYDDIIAGAPERDTVSQNNGIVWVWHGSAAGIDGPPDWSALGVDLYAGFGETVAGLGDVNGDGYDDIGVQQTSGSRLYGWLGGALGLGPNGTPGNADWVPEPFDGTCLAGAGDVDGDGYDDVIVGMRYANEVYLYLGGVGGPGVLPDWSEHMGSLAHQFGSSVDGAGDVNGDGYDDVIIGAWLFDAPEIEEGMVFVYHGSAAGLSLLGPDWSAESDQEGARLGRSVAGVGDLNGDGYDDVVAGALWWDAAQPDEGAAFAWLGSADGLHAEPTWTRASAAPGSEFGLAVAGAGDVNGDGFPDVLVGAPLYSEGQDAEGRVSLYLGGPGGVASDPAWQLLANQPGSDFGGVLASGDIDGDGFMDLAVGAPDFQNLHPDEGAVFVFRGSSTGLLWPAAWAAVSDQAGAAFGSSLALADVDADGFDDLLVGAPLMDGAGSDEGFVFLWKGSAAGLGTFGLPGNEAWSTQGDTDDDRLGTSVAGADVDNDGDADVLVGAPGWDGTLTDEGAALLYRSDGNLPGASIWWTALGNETGSEMGFTVASAGDVNGDGWEDIAVGLPGSDLFGGGIPAAGRVRVYHGALGGPGPTSAWNGDGSQAGARFGRALAGVGDVNGDGYDDLLIGAPTLDVVFGPLPADQGRALLFYGSPTGLQPANGNPTNAPWQAMVNGGNAASGWALAGGDVNGDGYADLLVGAPGASVALAFTGSASGPESTADWIASRPGSSLGTGLAVGDLDGDGLEDVAAGGPGGPSDLGVVDVYPGALDGPWFDLGNALPGLRGEPRLLGNGTLVGGEVSQVVLVNLREQEQVYLIVGFSTIYAPAKGGVVVPGLDVVFQPIPTGNAPALTIGAVWPVGLPSGVEVYFQAWITDPSGPVGFAASNGLGATLP